MYLLQLFFLIELGVASSNCCPSLQECQIDAAQSIAGPLEGKETMGKMNEMGIEMKLVSIGDHKSYQCELV